MFQGVCVGSDLHLIHRICEGVILATKMHLYITMAIPKSVYSTYFDQFCRVWTHEVGSSSNNLPAKHSGTSKIEWELILYDKMDKKRALLYRISSHLILEAPECVAGRLFEHEPTPCVKTRQN